MYEVRLLCRQGMQMSINGWECRYVWTTWTVEDSLEAACAEVSKIRSGMSRDVINWQIIPPY